MKPNKSFSVSPINNPKEKERLICDTCGKELKLFGTKFMTGIDERVYTVCGSCYQDLRMNKMNSI